MITASLPAITDRWKAFWPINELRPLAVVDYISYFLLIKKLDDEQLIMERNGQGDDKSCVFLSEHDELRWHNFNDMDARSLYTLFTKENGVFDFIQRYGQSDHLYSDYLKHPLLVAPTPNLVANTVDIIKLLESQDNITRAEIFEYFLYEQEVAGQNGQVFAPAKVIKLLVAMMNPTAGDIIWDPAVGNGSFLVNSVKYILNKKSGGAANYIREANFQGTDFDPVLLRIAAVNMMLNGIDKPVLERVNIFQDNFFLRERPTIILSNLFFKASEDKLTGSGTAVPGITGKKEIAFLQFILKNLKPGVRAAVIIPETILYDNAEDLISLRSEIINEQALDAVISLPATNSLFSGAAILILKKSNSKVIDTVWFYKMKDTVQLNQEDALYNESKNIPAFSGDDMEMLTIWDNLNKGTLQETSAKSFFVTADAIKARQYNLSYKEYKRFATPPDFNNPTDIKTPEENTIKNIKGSPGQVIMNEESIPDEAPVKKRIGFLPILLMIIFGTAISLAFLYFVSKDDTTIAGTKVPVTTNAKAKTDLQVTQPDSLSGVVSTDKRDSTNISSQALPGNSKAGNKKPVTNLTRQTPAPAQPEQPVNITAADNTPSRQKYTVIQKAYFHNQPDISTRRKGYIIHWNNAVLNPLDEKNGFIYIVFTNHQGQTSKGWLNKKDLRPVR